MVEPEKLEIESLKKQLARARTDITMGTRGFMLGGMAAGFLLRWYLGDQKTLTVTGVPLIAMGSTYFGIFVAMTYVSIARFAAFLRWERGVHKREQQWFFDNN